MSPFATSPSYCPSILKGASAQDLHTSITRYDLVNRCKASSLPLLEDMNRYFSSRPEYLAHIATTKFVCVQHILETTVTLFQTLIDLGANPDNIYLVGKYYSTSPTARPCSAHTDGND